MKKATRSFEQAVSKTQGCACCHRGTFFVNETVDEQSHQVAVEIFQLQGHPEATLAFAWAWEEEGTRRYVGVLSAPPVDSPQKAVRAALATLRPGADSGSGPPPGCHLHVMPQNPNTKTECAFEFFEYYTVFRPVGSSLTFADAVMVISESLSFAAFLKCKHLLVDARQLTGFLSPTLWERFWMATEWAKITRGLRLVVVTQPELVDPAKFGVVVARNRGLFANVFTTERDALEWLLHPNPK
jgi:hypothetical protein